MSSSADAYLRRLKEYRLYICGDQLEEGSDLFTQRALTCTTNIEIPYFSPNCSKCALEICCYCGGENNLMGDNYISKTFTPNIVKLDHCATRVILQAPKQKHGVK
ncbi:hypothetical protein MAR_025779, partial [Mya arenaria]